MGDGQRDDRRPSLRRALAFLAGLAGLVLIQGSTDPPTTPLGWLGLLAGAALVSGAGTAVVDLVLSLIDAVLRALGRYLPASVQAVRRALTGYPRTALLVILVLTSAVLVAVAGPRAVDVGVGLRVWWQGCGNAVGLRMLATPDGLEAARQLEDAYERHTALDNHGCRTVDLYVYPTTATTAQEVRESGWSAAHVAAIRPRPDLVLPESTLYGLPEENADLGLVSVDSTPVAASPVVLAVPPAMAAEAMDHRNGRAWADVLARAQALGWQVARPDPAVSLTGEIATVSLYHVRDSQPWQLVGDDAARRVERWLAQASAGGGYLPGETTTDLLCRHRQLGTSPPAVTVSEQALVRYAAGLPLGGACTSREDPLPADRVPVGFYPRDTFALDHPLVHLTWTDTSRGQLGAVADLRAWLASDRGKRELNAVGLRPRNFPRGECPVCTRLGVLPGGTGLLEPPVWALLGQARAIYARAGEPGRVLLALDSSGSMRATFGVAVSAVRTALGHLGDRDEFGLWVFPGRSPPVERLVPVGRGTAGHRRAVESALTRVGPTGQTTPLFRAVADGVAAVRAGGGPRTRAVVVLTDGDDTAGDLSPGQFAQLVGGTNVPVFAIAVGDARCGAGDLAVVVRATRGTCYHTDFDNLDARLDGLFAALFGGDGDG